jgi:hypothetical protein
MNITRADQAEGHQANPASGLECVVNELVTGP